jgi:ABC-type antimicrobial peptide transport system permease subunit
VVGVVGDVKHFGPEEPARPEVYMLFKQAGAWLGRMSLVVRTQGEPEALLAGVRTELRRVDRDLPPVALRTMEQVMEESYAPRRFVTVLVAGFAGIALLLAAGGIYAQLAYAVSQRRQEIGLRMALGARGGQVAGMILRQGLLVTLIGLGVGLAGIFALSRLIQQMLFGVKALDVPTLAAVPAILLAVAALACVVPAWRASQADPAVTLRHD